MSAEVGFGFWTVVNSVTALGVLGGGSWLLSLALGQREMESWRDGVDTQIQKVDKMSEGTDRVVIALQRDVKHIVTDVADIKAGQQETLMKVTELVSRVPPNHPVK